MIKTSTFIFFLMINLNFAKANEEAPFKQILSENDKTEVLKLIDHICADSWCAGDYDYKFTKFSCNDTTSVCTLSFKIIDRDSKPNESHVLNRRCIFKEISSIDNIIHDRTLTQEFYDKLNFCVSDRESTSNKK